MSALVWVALVLSVLDTAFLLALVALVKILVRRPELATRALAGALGAPAAAPSPIDDLTWFKAPRD